MGKSQTKKKTQPSRRHNPIRVPDSHLGAGAGKADKSKQEAMVPVLAKLKSTDAGDRTWACAAVTNLIQNDPGTRRMLQSKNVVGELITRLTDDVDEVVTEAAGALRNLAIDGGHELCSEMYNKSIIPALVVLVGKVSTVLERIVTSQPVEGDAEINMRKVVFQLSENVVSLLWCMSEASHKTLAAVNAANLVPFLVGFLSARALLPISLTLAAAQCLYSLSPDNEPLREGLLSVPTGVATVLDVLRSDHSEQAKASGERKKASKKSKGKAGDAMDVAEVSEDGRYLLVRVLAAGIIRNVALPGSKSEAEIDVNQLTREVILPLLDPLLNVDLQVISNEVAGLAAQLPSPAEVAANVSKELKTDHKTSVERQLEATEIKLSTLIVGLEIMTSICAGLEDHEAVSEEAEAVPEEESDQDMDDEDEDANDEALIAQGREQDASAMQGGATNNVALVANVAQTLGFLVQSFALPARLSALALGTPLSYPPLPPAASAHAPTTALLSTIHLRALEAINNLYLTALASVGPNPPAGTAEQLQVQIVWDRLYDSAKAAVPSTEVLGVKGHEIRIEIMDIIIGGLWGIAKLTHGDLDVSGAQIQILQDASAVVSSDVVRVRCIETLAVLAARPRVTNEENMAIANWLMSSLSSTLPGPEILVAVLNALFDVYGDEERAYDVVFVSQRYLDVLASIVAKVRNEARKVDRRKLPELRLRAEEAYENLAAFVKYRRSLRR